ncbi:DUF805 domain-containing protein [Staphylococcus taiwanensis]|nr:DUF805 domain-containing protein [Staphylococcus taiwanensis]
MNPKVTFGGAFKLFWKNYFNFKGRSRRSEYWFMQLWHLIFYAPALAVYSVGVFFLLASLLSAITHIFVTSLIVVICATCYLIIYSLIIFIPQLALTIRRFHDTNRTMVAPIIIVVFVILTYITNLCIQYFGSNLDSDWRLTVIYVLGIIGTVASIYQMIIACLNSKPEKNKYGESPKYKDIK